MRRACCAWVVGLGCSGGKRVQGMRSDVMKKRWRLWGAVLLAGGVALSALAKDRAAPPNDGLRQAVVCPAFKGPADVAGVYYAEMLRVLGEADGIELLDGGRSLLKRQPEFLFRVTGAVVPGQDGDLLIRVTLQDAARQEVIATVVSTVNTNAAALKRWSAQMEKNIPRRLGLLPFESRVKRKGGQQSFTLDRGLGAGLKPGAELYLAVDEEPIISGYTGEQIGREASRTIGKVVVYRVMDQSAYARPADSLVLPRSAGLFVRSF